MKEIEVVQAIHNGDGFVIDMSSYQKIPYYKYGEWISVKDLLPEKYTYILTYTPSDDHYHTIKIKWVFSNSIKDILSSKSRFYKVTHWMPLPLPPKEIKS